MAGHIRTTVLGSALTKDTRNLNNKAGNLETGCVTDRGTQLQQVTIAEEIMTAVVSRPVHLLIHQDRLTF